MTEIPPEIVAKLDQRAIEVGKRLDVIIAEARTLLASNDVARVHAWLARGIDARMNLPGARNDLMDFAIVAITRLAGLPEGPSEQALLEEAFSAGASEKGPISGGPLEGGPAEGPPGGGPSPGPAEQGPQQQWPGQPESGGWQAGAL